MLDCFGIDRSGLKALPGVSEAYVAGNTLKVQGPQ